MEKIVGIALVVTMVFVAALMALPGLLEWKADQERIEVQWDEIYYLREDPHKGYILQAKDDPEGENDSRIGNFEDYEAGLAPVHVGSGREQKYGYMNQEGRFVIEPVFDYAWKFSEGLAEVVVDGLCGYIDTNGQYVAEPQYYKTEAFKDGYAAVAVEGGRIDDVCSSEEDIGLWGLIDRTGRVVIEPQYDSLSKVRGYRYVIAERDGREGLVDMDNNVLIPFEYEDMWVERREDELYIWAEKDDSSFCFDTRDPALTPVAAEYEGLDFVGK